MNKKIKELILVGILLIGTTGCIFKRDDLEGVNIYTTVYPVEYVLDYLYGYNSKVSSIYPAEVDLSTYKLTKKQIKTYSKGAVFVYNGKSDEIEIARDLKNANEDLKIIDVSHELDYESHVEELWMNPREYLWLAHNVKDGLEEYITNKYIIDEIDKNYENLNALISGFEAELSQIPGKAADKNIVVASETLKFLENYGFNVILVDESAGEIQNSVLLNAKNLIQDGTIKYVFMLDSDAETDTTRELVSLGAELKKVRSMTVKTEDDVKNNITYRNMMRDTIEAIKDEVYE